MPAKLPIHHRIVLHKPWPSYFLCMLLRTTLSPIDHQFLRSDHEVLGPLCQRRGARTPDPETSSWICSGRVSRVTMVKMSNYNKWYVQTSGSRSHLICLLLQRISAFRGFALLANFLGKESSYSNDREGRIRTRDHEIHKHPEHVFSGLEAIEVTVFDRISPKSVQYISFCNNPDTFIG